MLVGMACLAIGVSGTLVVLWQRPVEIKRVQQVNTVRETVSTTPQNTLDDTSKFNLSTTTFKADVATTTAQLNGQRAVKYTDKIGEFSFIVPSTWVVQYDVRTSPQGDKFLGTDFTVSEHELEPNDASSVSISFTATEYSFEDYLDDDNTNEPNLPKMEFKNVYSYKLKGLPAVHWERDTHIGLNYTTDFILRKYKKYNVAIDQTEPDDNPEIKAIINSLEL